MMVKSRSWPKVKAFSLIELMIVITIIGILAAVAVPAYQDYVVRSKVANALAFANHYKNQMSEYYNVNGVLPGALKNSVLNWGTDGTCGINTTTTCSNGVVDPTPEIANIYVGGLSGATNQDIAIKLANSDAMGEAKLKTILLRATITSSGLTWNCYRMKWDTPVMPASLAPANCTDEP